MNAQLAAYRQIFIDGIQDIRSELGRVASWDNSVNMHERHAAARVKADAYVYASAEQEALVSGAFLHLIKEVAADAVTLNQIKPSLFAIFSAADFDAITSPRSYASWDRRVDILRRSFCPDPLNYSGSFWPTDGKTLRPKHFDLIWKVLDAPGSWLTDPNQKLAIEDLAEGRNEVAHGRSQRVSFGLSKANADVLNTISRIEAVGDNYILGFDNYLSCRLYIR